MMYPFTVLFLNYIAFSLLHMYVFSCSMNTFSHVEIPAESGSYRPRGIRGRFKDPGKHQSPGTKSQDSFYSSDTWYMAIFCKVRILSNTVNERSTFELAPLEIAWTKLMFVDFVCISCIFDLSRRLWVAGVCPVTKARGAASALRALNSAFGMPFSLIVCNSNRSDFQSVIQIFCFEYQNLSSTFFM